MELGTPEGHIPWSAPVVHSTAHGKAESFLFSLPLRENAVVSIRKVRTKAVRPQRIERTAALGQTHCGEWEGGTPAGSAPLRRRSRSIRPVRPNG